MLRALTQEEYREHLDFAYGLALDMTRSGYPTYADGLKDRAEFEDRAALAFERENEEILLFEDDGQVLGWIHYYALPEDSYLDTQALCIKDRTEQAIDELLDYLTPKYPGFTIHFGLPEQNVRVIRHLTELGYTLQEESLVGVMRFEEYEPRPEDTELISIGQDNFERFAAIHAQWDGKMYWDNAHLRENLDQWNIYLLERDGQDIAAIYFIYMDGMLEIFGVDYAGDRFDPEAFRALMLKALNQGKADGLETFTYFHEEREAPVIKELGIRILGRYVMYAHKL